MVSASSSEPQLGEIYQEDFNMDRGDLQERMRLMPEEQLTSKRSTLRTDPHRQPQYRLDPDGHMRLNAIGPRVPYHPYEMYVRAQYPRTFTEASAISAAAPPRPMIRINPEFQASVDHPNIQFPVSYGQRTGMALQHKFQAQPRYIPETATSRNSMVFERPRGDFILDQHEMQRLHPYSCFIGVPRDHESPGQQDQQMSGLIQQNHAGPPIRANRLPTQDMNRLTSPRQVMIARPEPVVQHGLAYPHPRMVSLVDGAYTPGGIDETHRVEAVTQPSLAQEPFDQQNRIYRVGPNGNLSRNPVKRMPRNLQGQTLRVIPEASDTTIDYQGNIYKHGSNGQLIKFNPNIHKSDKNVQPGQPRDSGDRAALTPQHSKTAASQGLEDNVESRDNVTVGGMNQSTPSHTKTGPVYQNTVKEKPHPPPSSANNQFIKLVGVTEKSQDLAQQKVVVGQRISVSRGKVTESTPIPASGDPAGITIYRLLGRQPQTSVSILNEGQPNNSAEKAAYVVPTKNRLVSVLDGGPGTQAKGTGGERSHSNGTGGLISPPPLPIQIVSVESQAVGMAPGTQAKTTEASNPSKDNTGLDLNRKPANQSAAEPNPEPIPAPQKENPAKLFRVLNIDPQKTGPQRFYERAKNIVIPKSQKSPAPVLEDMLLLYTLTRLHPKLPKYIREQFSGMLGEGKRITDIREEILAVAEAFIAKETAASPSCRLPSSTRTSTNPQRKRAGVETGRKTTAKRKPVSCEESITEEDTTREVVEIIEQESNEVEVVYPYLYNPTTNHTQPYTQSAAPTSLQYLVMEPHEDLEMVVEEEPFDYNQGQARDKNKND